MKTPTLFLVAVIGSWSMAVHSEDCGILIGDWEVEGEYVNAVNDSSFRAKSNFSYFMGTAMIQEATTHFVTTQKNGKELWPTERKDIWRKCERSGNKLTILDEDTDLKTNKVLGRTLVDLTINGNELSGTWSMLTFGKEELEKKRKVRYRSINTNLTNAMPSNEYIYSNGKARYVGELKNNLPNGNGKIFFKESGNIYEGHVVDGKQNGNGKVTFSDNGRIEGEFINGSAYNAKEYDRNGTLVAQYVNGEQKLTSAQSTLSSSQGGGLSTALDILGTVATGVIAAKQNQRPAQQQAATNNVQQPLQNYSNTGSSGNADTNATAQSTGNASGRSELVGNGGPSSGPKRYRFMGQCVDVTSKVDRDGFVFYWIHNNCSVAVKYADCFYGPHVYGSCELAIHEAGPLDPGKSAQIIGQRPNSPHKVYWGACEAPALRTRWLGPDKGISFDCIN